MKVVRNKKINILVLININNKYDIKWHVGGPDKSDPYDYNRRGARANHWCRLNPNKQ